jgi:hypothetical protein
MRSIEWRLRYLDWRIVQLKAEIAVWHAAHPLADVWEQALDKDLAKIWRRLEPLQKKRRVELAAQEPLDDWYRGRENYHGISTALAGSVSGKWSLLPSMDVVNIPAV